MRQQLLEAPTRPTAFAEGGHVFLDAGTGGEHTDLAAMSLADVDSLIRDLIESRGAIPGAPALRVVREAGATLLDLGEHADMVLLGA